MPDQNQEQPNIERTMAGTGGQPAVGEFKLGSIVGGCYTLTAIVGRGGMGVVYTADHQTIKRNYALKALALDQINASNWIRFQSEGKAIARLEHHNIVKVYDMGIENGERPYYVMDLLEGPSLAEFIKLYGALNGDQAVEIFSQICAGLAYAHKSGIIHRDIKPANIILTGLQRPDQRDRPVTPPDLSRVVVKIVDFGLAKAIGDTARAGQSQTATGEIFGSPYYMSPEQCLGAKIDERSDIYSLGCALFECLTGSHPFAGETALQTVMMHQNQKPPRLADVRQDLEFLPGWEQLVATMLKKRPAERPQTMAAVAHDLERIKEGKPVKPEAIFAQAPLYEMEEEGEEVPVRTNKMLLVSVLSVLLLLLAAGGVVFKTMQNEKKEVVSGALILEQPQRERADVTEARMAFRSCGKISEGVISKNGQSIRVFHFPSKGIGQIGSYRGRVPVDATGTVNFLPADQVFLKITPGKGIYTLKIPSILGKIGPGDINRLEVSQLPEENEELKPELFEEIADWTSLHALVVSHFKISSQAALALSKIKPVDEVKLHKDSIEDKDLAQVKWLHEIVSLDISGTKEATLVLKLLSGAPRLNSLYMDQSSSSLAALQGLASCSALHTLSVSDCVIDDDKLQAISKINALQDLFLNDNPFKSHSLSCLAALKHLQHLSLKGMSLNQSDIDALQKKLPNCVIEVQNRADTGRERPG
jgi:serine/threonine protein kinase